MVREPQVRKKAYRKGENQILEQDEPGDVKEVGSRHLSRRGVLEIFHL